MVSSSTHSQRNKARVQSRSLQRHYNLLRQPTRYDPSAGRRGPVRTNQAQRCVAALCPSNATSHQAPALSISWE